MPPIIGTAMRCITSAPVPWLHMMGKARHDGTDGHHLRATRSTAPDMIAARRGRRGVNGRPFALASGLEIRQRMSR